MEFRESLNYYFVNETESQSKATFKIAKPDILINNLDKKKIRVQKFYLNNTSLPIFIPDRIAHDTVSYFNVSTDAGTTILVNNVLSIDSLKYYIILRDIANNDAVVVFIEHIVTNPDAPVPPVPINDDFKYYQTQYYYYHDFTHFLSSIIFAINDAYTAHPASIPANILNPIFWQNKDGYFQLFIQNESVWRLELSPSLINLFPFKNVKTPDGFYRIIFDSTPATINALTYFESDCNFYDTIFPFVELVFRSEDANLNPINFIDSFALQTNAQTAIYEKSILTYGIATNQFNAIYNYYKYVNENDSLWVNFYTNKDLQNHFTISLFLRLKNNLLIPYLLNPKEMESFTIEIKYLT